MADFNWRGCANAEVCSSSSRPLIVVDARVVLHYHGHGIARYTKEFLLQLASLGCQDLDFILLVNKNTPLANVSWPKNFRLLYMKTGWISLFGQWELAVVLRKLKPNLFHSPSFIVPFLSKAPLVTTIHDLNHVVLADNYSVFHRMYYSFFLAKKVRNAAAVVTVSDFSKQEIVKFFRIPEKLVTVVYNGISSLFFSGPNKLSEIDLHSFTRRFEIPSSFILASGNRKPHKNIRRLVEAWSLMETELPLVLLSDFDSEVLRIAQRKHKKHLVYFLRFVADEDLPLLYSLAKVFVFPSLYEGFGLPPLEAAACGRPVVVANRASLPEVLSGGALYFEPEDVNDLRRVLEFAITADCNDIALKGKQKALGYSWLKTAEQTLAVYRSVLENFRAEPKGLIT